MIAFFYVDGLQMKNKLKSIEDIVSDAKVNAGD